MLVLRCTAKAQTVLGKPGPASGSLPPGEDDWYVNLLWFDRRKCLLVTHAGTLFTVFLPDVRAGSMRPPGPPIVDAISQALTAENIRADALGPLDRTDVVIAKTADRRVLGSMNDLAVVCELAVADARGVASLDLGALHHRLHRHLLSTRGYVYPVDLAWDRDANRT